MGSKVPIIIQSDEPINLIFVLKEIMKLAGIKELNPKLANFVFHLFLSSIFMRSNILVKSTG